MISALKTDRGLALQDLLNGAYDYVDSLELKPHARVYLLDYLATTEYVLVVINVPYRLLIFVQVPVVGRCEREDPADCAAGRRQACGRDHEQG